MNLKKRLEPIFEHERKSLFILIFLFFVFVITALFLNFQQPKSISQTVSQPRQNAPFEVRGVGSIPNMTQAMRDNRALRSAVREFCDRDGLDVFLNPQRADQDIVKILLLWSGVDLSIAATENTEEGLHPHVDHFLRRAYSLADNEPIVNNPLLGDDAWLRLFVRYKARMISLCDAGKDVFDGIIDYNVERDRLIFDVRISKQFIDDFDATLQASQDRVRLKNNFLAYIEEVRGLRSLSEDEKAYLKPLLN